MVASIERTLAIIKPDAVAAGTAPGIEALIESNDFAVLARMELTLSEEQAAELYEEYESDPIFFSALLKEMTSGPIVVLALEKPAGVASWLELLGPTDAAVAAVEVSVAFLPLPGVTPGLPSLASPSQRAACATLTPLGS